MATTTQRLNKTGVPGDLMSIAAPRRRNQSPEELARAAGYNVSGGVAWQDMGGGGPGVMDFGPTRVTTPLSSFGGGGAAANPEMEQLRQALFADYNSMQGANQRNFDRGNIPIEQLMQSMQWDTTDMERLGREGANSLNPLDTQMQGADRELQALGRGISGMEESADQSYRDVMGRLKQSDADINAGYGRQDAAESTMRGGIDEYKQRTMAEESSAADNIAGQVDSQIKQLNADPNLRPEEKAALRYQMKASIGPSVQRVVTEIGTKFNENLVQLKSALASLQSEGAKLRISGAQAKMYGSQIAASAGGQRTAAKGQATDQRMQLEMQRQKVRESRVALKQMQQQMREGAKMAAMQARLNGNEILGRLIEMNPESPVSMAAVFAAMMAARSAPSGGGGGGSRRASSNQDPLFTTQGVQMAGGGGGGWAGTNWSDMGGNQPAPGGGGQMGMDPSYSAGSTSQGSNRPR